MKVVGQKECVSSPGMHADMPLLIYLLDSSRRFLTIWGQMVNGLLWFCKQLVNGGWAERVIGGQRRTAVNHLLTETSLAGGFC